MYRIDTYALQMKPDTEMDYRHYVTQNVHDRCHIIKRKNGK